MPAAYIVEDRHLAGSLHGPVTRWIAGTRSAIVMAALATSDLRRSFSFINMICGTLLAY